MSVLFTFEYLYAAATLRVKAAQSGLQPMLHGLLASGIRTLYAKEWWGAATEISNE
jgi:hypothetical protein